MGGWLFVQVVAAVSLGLSQRYVVPLGLDNPANRRIKTTVYVMRRLALVFVALLGLGYIIHRVGVFDSFGLSVLASAGVLGVLVTIAARPLLGNMVAGLQIALTDPLRVGDVVVYDGHWATVEDIAFAHTVLRTWLDTRLIVPHSDFLSKPFENWSKEGEEVRRIVKIPVDYRIDVDQVRRKVEEIVEGDPRSTSAPLVELVEAEADAAVIWIWISGPTSFALWYLHNVARDFDRQVAKVQIRIAVMNGCTALGIPVTGTVGCIRPGKGKPRPSVALCNIALWVTKWQLLPRS